LTRPGRIAIPQSLREFAALNRECAILGIDKYIEIWDTEQYRQYWNENEAEFRSAAEELGSVFL